MQVSVTNVSHSLIIVSQKKFICNKIWMDLWNDINEESAGRCPCEDTTGTGSEKLQQMGQKHITKPPSSVRFSRSNMKIACQRMSNRLNTHEYNRCYKNTYFLLCLQYCQDDIICRNCWSKSRRGQQRLLG